MDKVILVLITSDMGFVGGLNTEVVDMGLREVRKKDELHLLALGEKGYLQLEERGYKFEFLPGMGSNMNFSLAEKVRVLERENTRLKRRAERAEGLVELQKKVSEILGIELNRNGEKD